MEIKFGTPVPIVFTDSEFNVEFKARSFGTINIIEAEYEDENEFKTLVKKTASEALQKFFDENEVAYRDIEDYYELYNEKILRELRKLQIDAEVKVEMFNLTPDSYELYREKLGLIDPDKYKDNWDPVPFLGFPSDEDKK